MGPAEVEDDISRLAVFPEPQAGAPQSVRRKGAMRKTGDRLLARIECDEEKHADDDSRRRPLEDVAARNVM